MLLIIFFLFLNLLRSLSIMLSSLSFQFLKFFWFFNLEVFYLITLDLGLAGTSMNRTGTPKVILISIANIEKQPKSSFGLYIDSFLHKFFKTIKLLAVLLYFDFDEKL